MYFEFLLTSPPNCLAMPIILPPCLASYDWPQAAVTKRAAQSYVSSSGCL